MAHPGNWSARTREVQKMHVPPGTMCSPSTQSPELLKPGKFTKWTVHLGLFPWEAPKNLNYLYLGSAHSAGPTWDSALAEHSRACGPGKYTPPWAVANPVWLSHWEHSPHMPVLSVSSVSPSPKDNWKSEPKKVVIFAPLCQGEN